MSLDEEVKTSENYIVVLNVGGTKYSTTLITLCTLEPESLFNTMFKGALKVVSMLMEVISLIVMVSFFMPPFSSSHPWPERI